MIATRRSRLITGVLGEVLTPAEADFLAAVRPCGLILFSRNCSSAEQIRALVQSVKNASGLADLLVLIDQEGGRVQRLRPPLGRTLPPAAAYGQVFETSATRACRAAFEVAQLVATDLRALAINMVCAPVLDIPVEGAHDIIGDRAYGRMPDKVAALGRAVADGFMAGGVLPVMKHIPGHGRGTEDSHFRLPVVTASHDQLAASDFAPFKALADLPAAMTAHIVYRAIDPENPASTSKRVVDGVIRGEIGFDGVLMSDDISMKALAGDFGARAAAVIEAGCDLVLHCNGDLAEMRQIARAVPPLDGEPLRRFEAARALVEPERPAGTGAGESALAEVSALYAKIRESV